MAKKMYYSEQEAAQLLGVNPEQLTELIRQRKLREYRDGARRMFKAEEVDALAKPTISPADSGEIELSPADTADAISLTEADESRPAGKEDTVITAEGISIFDEEDLEIEAADPMAKTQIAPSLDDQISIEGVGSGSGLLDLTRESDDTSLGAEVLDHIDMTEAVAEESPMPSAYAGVEGPAVIMEAPMTVEAPDPSAGLFGGMTLGAAIVALLIGAVTLAVITDTLPGYLAWMQGNLTTALAVAAVVVVVCAVAGMLVGKSAAQRQALTRRGA